MAVNSLASSFPTRISASTAAVYCASFTAWDPERECLLFARVYDLANGLLALCTHGIADLFVILYFIFRPLFYEGFKRNG
jgi:hypothetical protein